MVSVGVSKVGANWPDIRRCWSEDQWARTTVTCFWLKIYCLQGMRSVPYSLHSNNAMLLLLRTERRAWETINLLERQIPVLLSFLHIFSTNSTDLNLLDYRRWREMQQQVYQVHDVDFNQGRPQSGPKIVCYASRPSPFLPPLSFPSSLPIPFVSFSPSIPSPSEVGTPQLQLRGWGALKLSQRVRAGRQTHSDAFRPKFVPFWVPNAAYWCTQPRHHFPQKGWTDHQSSQQM